jgi:hypothetical protein
MSRGGPPFDLTPAKAREIAVLKSKFVGGPGFESVASGVRLNPSGWVFVSLRDLL